MRIPISAAGAVVLSLALVGCGDSDPGDNGTVDTITIGSIHPLSGGLAGAGKMMDDAVKMAVDDINASGGIASLGGAQLRVDSADSQGQPEVGQSEAQRLTSSGAVALVGTYQSNVTQNVAAVAERSKVPLIIDVAVDDAILQQGYAYTFRIQPDATGMGTAGADGLTGLSEQAGDSIETVSYIHIEGAFGDSVFAAFKEQAEANGITVAREVTYAGANFNDATTQVSEAAAANPDAIVVTGYYPDSLLIAQAVAALAPDIKAVYGIANGGFDDENFPGDAGAAGEGILSANYHYDATSTTMADIRDRYQEKYGTTLQTAGVLSYQAVLVIAAGLEAAGSTDPVALRDAIAGLSIDEPLLAFTGPIQFDETGQNINATAIVMQIQSGKVEQVYPEQFETAPLKYPAVPVG
ncbi:MAG TPA: ABC transporter substrate-binding protein [Jiangellales bacterium]|nr:ABC transporter substrate-binding protein [Jiangellales bacterium]